MSVETNLLLVSALILVFITLLMIGRPGKPKKGRPTKEERRAHARYETALRVRYKTAVQEGISWIRDVSNGGVRIFLTGALKTLNIGESLEIEINIPNENKPVSVQGTIAWSREDVAGFSVDEAMQPDLSRVARYVSNEGMA